jgi:hypothetical protein
MILLFARRHQLAVLAAMLALPRDKLSMPLGKDDKKRILIFFTSHARNKHIFILFCGASN